MNIRATSNFVPADLARFEQMLVPKLIAGAGKAADLVVAEAQAIVPVRDGELQQSIGKVVEWIGRSVNGYVQASAGHAAFVEFGTGLHGSGTYPYTLPVAGVPITGGWVYDYKNQNWQGMVARPYLRPALDTTRDSVLSAFGV